MITVFGARGFVGSEIIDAAAEQGIDTYVPSREEIPVGFDLGDVIYAIGLTADFRARPFATMEAHVAHFCRVAQRCSYKSITYLSSTRVYHDVTSPESRVQINASSPDSLYNLSKLAGESICLHAARNGRVARLSNVYGPDYLSDNFLSSILRQAAVERRVVISESPMSQKDYIHVGDVASALIRIAIDGKGTIYNVASGINRSHLEIVEALSHLANIPAVFVESDNNSVQTAIDTKDLMYEFPFQPRSILDDIPHLFTQFETYFTRQRSFVRSASR